MTVTSHTEESLSALLVRRGMPLEDALRAARAVFALADDGRVRPAVRAFARAARAGHHGAVAVVAQMRDVRLATDSSRYPLDFSWVGEQFLQ